MEAAFFSSLDIDLDYAPDTVPSTVTIEARGEISLGGSVTILIATPKPSLEERQLGSFWTKTSLPEHNMPVCAWAAGILRSAEGFAVVPSSILGQGEVAVARSLLQHNPEATWILEIPTDNHGHGGVGKVKVVAGPPPPNAKITPSGTMFTGLQAAILAEIKAFVGGHIHLEVMSGPSSVAPSLPESWDRHYT